MLLSFMAATAFLGMWISNTATSALMLAVLLPILGSLDAGDPFRKALVLGIPFAARIGGITTPVGSPTNALALGLLAERGIHVNFLTWMSATLPLAVLLLLMTSGILYILFPPRQAAVPCSMEPTRPFDRDARLVLFIGAATAGLWLTSPWHRMPEYLTALLCAGVLAAMRLITVEDLKKIDWDILILMWGGLALGEGMMITGLADWAMTLPVYPHEKWLLYLAVCLVTVLLSTFMSNTATVNLLIPVALSIPAGDASMLAVLVALAASFDLGLPISTPPMAMAYGTKELSISDMLKAGTVFALVANVLLLAGVEFMMKEVFVR
jgi:sodium-dependent dicarboxylate transporter 2/3/5